MVIYFWLYVMLNFGQKIKVLSHKNTSLSLSDSSSHPENLFVLLFYKRRNPRNILTYFRNLTMPLILPSPHSLPPVTHQYIYLPLHGLASAQPWQVFFRALKIVTGVRSRKTETFITCCTLVVLPRCHVMWRSASVFSHFLSSFFFKKVYKAVVLHCDLWAAFICHVFSDVSYSGPKSLLSHALLRVRIIFVL